MGETYFYIVHIIAPSVYSQDELCYTTDVDALVNGQSGRKRARTEHKG